MRTKKQLLQDLIDKKHDEYLDSSALSELSLILSPEEFEKIGIPYFKVRNMHSRIPKYSESEIVSILSVRIVTTINRIFKRQVLAASKLIEIVRVWLWILEDYENLVIEPDTSNDGLFWLMDLCSEYNLVSPDSRDCFNRWSSDKLGEYYKVCTQKYLSTNQ